MGKGTGLIGNFRKKVGNVVGYTLKNSNNGEKQGIRTYQAIVTNPKSDSQSAQRMKLMPLQVFYTAFNDVLNHAFEGQKVGQMNRQRFMKLNMSSTTGLAPAVQKGERILAPIHAIVSSGSLTLDTSMSQLGSTGLSLDHLTASTVSAETHISNLTLKGLTDALLADNIALESGMEIAFIFIISAKDNPRSGIAMKFNIVLNSEDAGTSINDLFGRVGDYLDFKVGSNGQIQILNNTSHHTLLGAACIVSSRKSGGWSNNNATFYTTAYGDSYFYANDLYAAALATYGPSGSTLTSDLFLRQADNSFDALEPKAIISTKATAIELTGSYSSGTLSAANAVIATTRAGYKRVVVNSSGEIVDASGTVITVTTGTSPNQETVNLLPSMTTFADYATVLYGSF